MNPLKFLRQEIALILATLFHPARCKECGERVAGDSIGYVLGGRCLYHYWRWSRQK